MTFSFTDFNINYQSSLVIYEILKIDKCFDYQNSYYYNFTVTSPAQLYEGVKYNL